MKIALDHARTEYSVMELIDLLAEQSAVIAHEAQEDRRNAPRKSAQAFQDEDVQDDDMGGVPESALLLPSVRRARGERLWSIHLFNGINSRRLVARDAAGQPSRDLTKLLDLTVTRDVLAAWLRAEGHVVELASTTSKRRRKGRPSDIAQDGRAEVVWEVRESKRADVLALIIDDMLRAARNAGEPPPKTRVIFNRIVKRMPPGIVGYDQDEIKYQTHEGDVKLVDMEALRRRIERAVVKMPPNTKRQ